MNFFLGEIAHAFERKKCLFKVFAMLPGAVDSNASKKTAQARNVTAWIAVASLAVSCIVVTSTWSWAYYDLQTNTLEQA